MPSLLEMLGGSPDYNASQEAVKNTIRFYRQKTQEAGMPFPDTPVDLVTATKLYEPVRQATEGQLKKNVQLGSQTQNLLNAPTTPLEPNDLVNSVVQTMISSGIPVSPDTIAKMRESAANNAGVGARHPFMPQESFVSSAVPTTPQTDAEMNTKIAESSLNIPSGIREKYQLAQRAENAKKKETILGDLNKPINPVTGESNIPYQQYEIKKATEGANKQITNINTGVPFNEETMKVGAKNIMDNYNLLKNAPFQLQNIEEAKRLIKGAKGFMGPGGETLLNTAKFMNSRLGLNIDPNGISDAQELQSRAFQPILDLLKKMDAQPSQMQQVMLRDAIGGLGSDPNALPKMLDVIGQMIRQKVESHNADVASSMKRGLRYPYDVSIRLPSVKKNIGDMSDEELLHELGK